MKRFSVIISFLILLYPVVSFSGPKWTEKTAREKAFQNISYTIDVSQYPSVDPDLEENMKALANGQKRVGNRYITVNLYLPIAYVVSLVNDKGNQEETMFYGIDGRLLSIRFFLSPDYPRVAVFYCVDEHCIEGDKYYSRGELTAVSFHVTKDESFHFSPSGELLGHVKFQ